jgi:hypothetical protein
MTAPLRDNTRQPLESFAMMKYLVPVLTAAVGAIIGIFAFNKFLAGK